VTQAYLVRAARDARLCRSMSQKAMRK